MRTSIEALKEIRDRLTYFCLRTDGRYDPPWATELVGIIDEAVTDSHAFGNAATMREVLLKLDKWLYIGVDGHVHGLHDKTGEIERTIKAALSAPPRNCDRFRDVNLAYKRFKSYVEKKNPSFTKNSPTHTVWDALKWALMPYEEKEVETK